MSIRWIGSRGILAGMGLLAILSPSLAVAVDPPHAPVVLPLPRPVEEVPESLAEIIKEQWPHALDQGLSGGQKAPSQINLKVEPLVVPMGTPDGAPPAQVSPSHSAPTPSVSMSPQIGQGKLGQIQFDQVTLSDAMRIFASQTGMNIICSPEAGQTTITVYLRNVEPMSALEAIVKANGLFYRVDEASGIVRIATAQEYEKDLSSFREEQTRVFTLLYPNPSAVAQVISQIFGDRVNLNMADVDNDELSDLTNRFNRFDLVDGRALGLGTFGAGGVGGGGGAGGGFAQNNQLGLNDSLGAGGLSSRSRNQQNSINPQRRAAPPKLTASDLQRIEDGLHGPADQVDRERQRVLQQGSATIYISTIRRNNQIVVRTADTQSMSEIESLVKQLDVPTPTVLLEVKVLRIDLADGVNSAFEYFGGQPGEAASFSDGNLLPNFPGGNTAARLLADGLGVSGGVPGALTFQTVNTNFQFRLQMLESENRVTALATPLLLTTNNEVSRIFVGDTLPFTVGFTPSQVVGGINAVTGAVAATPITELRDVGQSLLITPSINADRTVTLRVVEENSERIAGGASIPIPATSGSGVTSVQVDTVRRRTLSGTIIAQDGMAVALGGLIEETISDSQDRVPVLGSLPGLGVLFRRQTSVRSRSELVIVIKPHVFNTPSESAAATQCVLDELSLHPQGPHLSGTLDTYSPSDVLRPDQEYEQRAKLFRFHNVKDGDVK